MDPRDVFGLWNQGESRLDVLPAFFGGISTGFSCILGEVTDRGRLCDVGLISGL